MAKTKLEEVNRNIYDIKNKDEYEFKIQKGLTKKIVEEKGNAPAAKKEEKKADAPAKAEEKKPEEKKDVKKSKDAE